MSQVGGLVLPLSSGDEDAPLTDPVVETILDFLGFSLQAALNPKLGTVNGMSLEACPIDNRFAYDPGDTFVRNPFPALYVFWPGISRVVPETLVYHRREREITILYVFDEHIQPSSMSARSGLLNAVDAVFTTVLERGFAATYTPPGGSLGQNILAALSLQRLEYKGAQQGRLEAIVPSEGRQTQGQALANQKRGFPALRARVDVWERVRFDNVPPTAPADLMADIQTNEDGDFGNTLTVLEREINADEEEP